MQTSQQTQTQLLDYLVLLETLQSLENYKEFCYNLYLLATYDHHNRPSRITYPNGYFVTNHYKNGLLDKVIGKEGKVHYEVNGLNAFGAVEQAHFANGISTGIDYDSAGYVKNINSYGVPFGNVQSLTYGYDGLGNVVDRNESNINGKHINEHFQYDTMNRLTKFDVTTDVEVRGFALTKTYDYDAIGNMISQTGIGNYDYSNTSYGPHAVNSAGARTYAYDLVGNMTNRNGDTITYNPLNKPATLTNHSNNKTVTFTYGAGGQRYMKQTSDGKQTYYLGKAYEEQVEDNTQKEICYITLGGKTIGTHTEVKDTDYVQTNPHYNEASYNRYFHTDALGSITAITDDSGTVVERRSYEAFGKIRAMDYGTNNNTIANTTIQTTRAFTGHEQIAELSGLVHMNARIYDSDIGRFLSADTVVQDPHDSQAYNRYSYARNNPMVFTDPSGHSWWTDFRDKWFKPIAAIIVSAILVIATGGAFTAALGSFWGSVATGALAGAASGAIMTGTLSGTLKGAAFGAISAGVAYGIGHGGGLFAKVRQYGGAVGKAALHGISRAAISKLQTGSGKGGFLSGFASSLLGGVVNGVQNATTTVKVTVAAIAGGTASVIGGGKFANGAMSGAFIMLFNDLYANQYSKEVNDATTLEFRKNHPNSFSVHAHGDKRGFVVNDRYYYEVDEIRQVLNANGWDGKQKLILFSCNTGNGDNSIASILSEGLGVDVYAPTEYYAIPSYALRIFDVQGYVSNKYYMPSGYMKKF